MIAYAIVGGQWGSEGKGSFAHYIAAQKEPDGAVCAFSPNAGHTAWVGNYPAVFKTLPVGSVAESVRRVFIGPGAVINPTVLRKELDEFAPMLKGKEIMVHESAGVVLPEDVWAESQTLTRIASTMQGTSEAMIRKLRRRRAWDLQSHLGIMTNVVSDTQYRQAMAGCSVIQVEGCQGMDLSLNVGYKYPYVTSRDCTPAQVLADCGVHHRDLWHVHACIRTLPIRVGNLYDADSNEEIGNSGPCYPDQVETTWEQIGRPQEYTTVTKRVRRVFSFSWLQTRKLLDLVRPDSIFLAFCDYLRDEEVEGLRYGINDMAGFGIVQWMGYGPADVRPQTLARRALHRPQPPEYGEAP